MLKKLTLGVLALLSMTQSQAALAETLIEENPSAWRLENNGPDSILISWSSSSCIYGRLILSSSATAGDRDRFWATVLSAKLSQKQVGIVYNVSGQDCVVSRFYLREG